MSWLVPTVAYAALVARIVYVLLMRTKTKCNHGDSILLSSQLVECTAMKQV